MPPTERALWVVQSGRLSPRLCEACAQTKFYNRPQVLTDGRYPEFDGVTLAHQVSLVLGQPRLATIADSAPAEGSADVLLTPRFVEDMALLVIVRPSLCPSVPSSDLTCNTGHRSDSRCSTVCCFANSSCHSSLVASMLRRVCMEHTFLALAPRPIPCPEFRRCNLDAVALRHQDLLANTATLASSAA